MSSNDIYKEIWHEAMIHQLKQIAFATAPTCSYFRVRLSAHTGN